MQEIATLQYQRKNRPKIEDVIPHCVAAEQQKTALDFIAWFRENKMNPGWSGVHNAWDAKCKGSTICKISLRNPGWALTGDNERSKNYTWVIKLYLNHKSAYEEAIINEGLQSIIWDGMYECTACLGGKKPCLGGRDYTVYGKEYKGVCPHSFYREIFDPDETTLNGVKRLLELEKQARNDVTNKKTKGA